MSGGPGLAACDVTGAGVNSDTHTGGVLCVTPHRALCCCAPLVKAVRCELAAYGAVAAAAAAAMAPGLSGRCVCGAVRQVRVWVCVALVNHCTDSVHVCSPQAFLEQ